MNGEPHSPSLKARACQTANCACVVGRGPAAGQSATVRAREASYVLTEKAEDEANSFLSFIASEAREEDTPDRPPDARAESERLRRRITQRLRRRTKDTEDFGFSDG